MRMPWNFMPSKALLPELIVVAAITSASSRICCLIHVCCFFSHVRLFWYADSLRLHACHSSSQLLPQGSSPTSSAGSDSSSNSCFISCCFALTSSIRQRELSSSRTLAAFPIRTTFTPFFARPIAMLSTAMLHSEVHSNGRYPMVCTHFVIMRTEVWVLPVPGGPCTMVRRLDIEPLIASRCAADTLGMASTCRQALCKRSWSTSGMSSFANNNVLAFRSF
mmetsp:Transcript_103638/g.317323  ORF Transcript_103638/g.317323 Transcript_103638/m.317323 type:complete len:221 (-) Transcript_103638:51-713(-)